MSLEGGIWVLRPGGVTWKGEKEEEEKFPMCESIGHRPLRGRCPKSANGCESVKHKSQLQSIEYKVLE